MTLTIRHLMMASIIAVAGFNTHAMADEDTASVTNNTDCVCTQNTTTCQKNTTIQTTLGLCHNLYGDCIPAPGDPPLTSVAINQTGSTDIKNGTIGVTGGGFMMTQNKVKNGDSFYVYWSVVDASAKHPQKAFLTFSTTLPAACQSQ